MTSDDAPGFNADGEPILPDLPQPANPDLGWLLQHPSDFQDLGTNSGT